MVDATHKSFRADDRSFYAIIKKDIHNIVVESGFSAKKVAEIDIIVSEMTSNLSKYAVGGEILFASFDDYAEVLCIDDGPGIIDLKRMVSDGTSTSSTLGHGLGSISRLSDVFDIYSVKHWGTIVLSRIYKKSIQSKGKSIIPKINPLVISKPGETISGDGTYYEVSSDYVKILVADGLGHGIEANKAVNEAVISFKECNSTDPVETLRFIHNQIRRTRGLVGTILFYNIKAKIWRAVGVGNISLKLTTHLTSRNLMSYNGIIGHNIPNTMKVQEFSNSDFHQLVLCSDGIKSRWEMPNFSAITKHDLSIQAASIYKDYGRKTDDMSVILIKSM